MSELKKERKNLLAGTLLWKELPPTQIRENLGMAARQTTTSPQLIPQSSLGLHSEWFWSHL